MCKPLLRGLPSTDFTHELVNASSSQVEEDEEIKFSIC